MKLKINDEYQKVDFFSFLKLYIITSIIWVVIVYAALFVFSIIYFSIV